MTALMSPVEAAEKLCPYKLQGFPSAVVVYNYEPGKWELSTRAIKEHNCIPNGCMAWVTDGEGNTSLGYCKMINPEGLGEGQ